MTAPGVNEVTGLMAGKTGNIAVPEVTAEVK